ncbi:YqgQ family protein [Jeotgalibacillus marinus]|uniref:YqgQ family protein n=1 Tax=Jeotgalibacillus marinus TaxID=86667 RepID=A0ABV3PZA5_9BACL
MTLTTVFDVQQLLKRFGIFVYVGDRATNLDMMELEIRDLYQSQLIDSIEYQTAILLLRREIGEEKQK